MQILLANAKIMRNESETRNFVPVTEPLFKDVAERIADEMARMDVGEISSQFHCSMKIAAENWQRFHNFHVDAPMPAIMAFNGQAYKHLKATELTKADLEFASQHLWITCFLYGLLRPMDAVVPYRMENDVKLELTDDLPVNNYWRNIVKNTDGRSLTDILIDSIKSDDGLLVHLSTEEYEHLFQWQQVCREVQVVQPMFYVRKGNRLSVQAVWAKSCRGAMLRYILQNHITDVELLKSFSYEGFNYVPSMDDEVCEETNGEKTLKHLLFIREF